MTSEVPVDAILLLSFGGPEAPDEVRPFLENVTRGRGVPPERLDEVEEHYQHFGGVSPINALNRELIAALRRELAAAGHDLPVYFGNRNWHPLAEDTVTTMAAKSIPGFDTFEEAWVQRAPLGWDPTAHEPTAKAICALLSDLFPATTGEIVHVDGGFHAMGA